jgi:hypothetical protein
MMKDLYALFGGESNACLWDLSGKTPLETAI